MHVGDEVILERRRLDLPARAGKAPWPRAWRRDDSSCSCRDAASSRPRESPKSCAAAAMKHELRRAATSPCWSSLSIGVSRIGERDPSASNTRWPRPRSPAAPPRSAAATGSRLLRRRQSLPPAPEASSGNRCAESRAALGTATPSNFWRNRLLPLARPPADPRFEILLRVRAARRFALGAREAAGGGRRSPESRASRSLGHRAIHPARLAACRDCATAGTAREFSLERLRGALLADAEFWRHARGPLVRNPDIEPGTLTLEFPEEAAAAAIGTIAPSRCTGCASRGFPSPCTISAAACIRSRT